jgi:hypothetical protein
LPVNGRDAEGNFFSPPDLPGRGALLPLLQAQRLFKEPIPGGTQYMSHLVTIQTRVQDPAAIMAACGRLGLPVPVQGTAELYSGSATGLLLQLPGWTFPAVIDASSGTLRYDNYEGRWGEQQHLDHFLQMYSVEKAKLEARAKGYSVNEQTLQDGSIKLQITQGA